MFPSLRRGELAPKRKLRWLFGGSVAAGVVFLLQLLTGLPCGEPDAVGIYPEGSLHRLVSDRLDEFGRTLRAASEGEEKKPHEGSS